MARKKKKEETLPALPKQGIKHLVECNCILPQYKNRPNPIFHQFVVFSIIDENDQVIQKIAECPNCGILHRVIEIGKSEIITKENARSLRTISEIKFSIPEQISAILDSNQCDISTWEEAEFILQEKQWGKFIVLSKERDSSNNVFGKVLFFNGIGQYKVESFARQEEISTH